MRSPFPKAFPRGGGIWDQDPILMRDFRLIQKTEIQCKDDQARLEEAQNKVSGNKSSSGGDGGLGNVLDQYIEEQEGGSDYF